jgi:hypothetical protein
MKKRIFGLYMFMLGLTLFGQFLFGKSVAGANDKIVLALIGCGGQGLSCIVNCCKINENVIIKTVCDGGSSFKYMQKAPNDIRNDATRFPNWRNYSARVEIYGTEGLMYLGRHGGGWQVIGSGDKIVAEDGTVFPDNAYQKNSSTIKKQMNSPKEHTEKDTK